MRHPEFPMVSFLAIPLLLSSLPSHIRARSVATIALLAWLTVLNIIRGVNSLIWANNTVIRLEVWCDISTKIVIGFTFAVPLSALCICRHLENISSNRQAVTTKADRRRRMKFEALMCFGLPMIFMALHYVVQGHRFDLIEDVGCYPSTYFSVPAVIIVWVPPLVISLISLMYAIAAFHHFLQRRIEFAAILRSSNSAISPGRYFRLMALAVFEILWDSGTNIYIIYYNTFTGLRPWISWENVHSNFSRVATFPHVFLPPWAIIQLIWQWWIIPISSIAFFLFFGFGEEAMSDYRGVIVWFRRTILCQTTKPGGFLATPVILPVHSFTSDNNSVVFSPSTGDASGLKKEAWDDLSLKMPDVVQHIPLPSRDDLSSNVYLTFLPRGDGSQQDFLSRKQSTSSFPSSRLERASSMAESDIGSPSSPSYGDLQRLSTLSGADHIARIHSASPSNVPSLASFRAADDRSPSPEHEISVSPAYAPGTDVTTRQIPSCERA